MEYLNKKILNYNLTNLIGEGGMAYVYEGVHVRLGSKVAIKILNPILSANTQIRARFENEAAIMASLKHPNIVKILDDYNQDGMLAIVMELLEGKDLNETIKSSGALDINKSVSIFLNVLDAFIYAHNKGIVHRDIKPANIYIGRDGQVKILDFGIAKLFGTGLDKTSTGTQIGTPIYMSPEQVKGERSIDHRSDIYSLGVTFYFMLKGKAPYNSDTESNYNIFIKIVNEPLPELIEYPELNEIIKKAVAKDRNDRFQDVDSFKLALEQLYKVDNPRIQFMDKVTIGSQIWTTKNLDVEAYRNGDAITQVQDSSTWAKLSTGAWCYYENKSANGSSYGKLYNWYAVNDPRGLAPKGYHIPSNEEWTTLTDYLGGQSQAGTKMKSSSGWPNYFNGSNTIGFEGLPGGYRNSFGDFNNIGAYGFWWSSSESNDRYAWGRCLKSSGDIGRSKDANRNGFSVRCLRD